jgi:hypothetical protein
MGGQGSKLDPIFDRIGSCRHVKIPEIAGVLMMFEANRNGKRPRTEEQISFGLCL